MLFRKDRIRIEMSREGLYSMLGSREGCDPDDMGKELVRRFQRIKGQLDDERASNVSSKEKIAELEKRARKYEHEVNKLRKRERTLRYQRASVLKLKSRMLELDEENAALVTKLADLEERLSDARSNEKRTIQALRDKVERMQRRNWQCEKRSREAQGAILRMRRIISDILEWKRRNFAIVIRVPEKERNNMGPLDGLGHDLDIRDLVIERLTLGEYNRWLRRSGKDRWGLGEGPGDGPARLVPIWDDGRITLKDLVGEVADKDAGH